MINSVSNSPSFAGVARLSRYGKDPLVMKTTKMQDETIKAFANAMGKKGELLTPVSKEKSITFERLLEMLFNKKINFGKSEKYMSNITNISKTKNSDIPNYISYGNIHPENKGGIHFTLKLN